MEWVMANWFWVLILVVFVATHLFGHGAHGGHSGHGGGARQRSGGAAVPDEAPGRIVDPGAGGHQH